MKKQDIFSGYHPIVNFIYFALVICFGMLLMHPLCLAVSLTAAVTYAVYLGGRKALRTGIFYLLPTVLLAAVINPVFSHEGVTILTYLPSGNPLTLESILYGIAAAVMVGTVILWFSCYNTVMTSDKFVYLFGRIIPALSLVLSMALRFVPHFKNQFRQVLQVQQSMGTDIYTGSMLQRLRSAIKVLSIVVTWALENAIETADSMKSRGYGLPGRTAFSIYRFDERDHTALCWLLSCGLYIFCGWLARGLAWRYYPTLKGTGLGLFPATFQLVYLALCFTPLILNLVEDRKWKHLRSDN